MNPPIFLPPEIEQAIAQQEMQQGAVPATDPMAPEPAPMTPEERDAELLQLAASTYEGGLQPEAPPEPDVQYGADYAVPQPGGGEQVDQGPVVSQIQTSPSGQPNLHPSRIGTEYVAGANEGMAASARGGEIQSQALHAKAEGDYALSEGVHEANVARAEAIANATAERERRVEEASKLKDFWENSSTPMKVLSIVGGMLGGFLAPGRGGRNYFNEQLEGTIQRDLQIQKHNIDQELNKIEKLYQGEMTQADIMYARDMAHAELDAAAYLNVYNHLMAQMPKVTDQKQQAEIQMLAGQYLDKYRLKLDEADKADQKRRAAGERRAQLNQSANVALMYDPAAGTSFDINDEEALARYKNRRTSLGDTYAEVQLGGVTWQDIDGNRVGQLMMPRKEGEQMRGLFRNYRVMRLNVQRALRVLKDKERAGMGDAVLEKAGIVGEESSMFRQAVANLSFANKKAQELGAAFTENEQALSDESLFGGAPNKVLSRSDTTVNGMIAALENAQAAWEMGVRDELAATSDYIDPETIEISARTNVTADMDEKDAASKKRDRGYERPDQFVTAIEAIDGPSADELIIENIEDALANSGGHPQAWDQELTKLIESGDYSKPVVTKLKQLREQKRNQDTEAVDVAPDDRWKEEQTKAGYGAEKGSNWDIARRRSKREADIAQAAKARNLTIKQYKKLEGID